MFCVFRGKNWLKVSITAYAFNKSVGGARRFKQKVRSIFIAPITQKMQHFFGSILYALEKEFFPRGFYHALLPPPLISLPKRLDGGVKKN